MEKTRITLVLLVLCVRVEYMLGALSPAQLLHQIASNGGGEDHGALPPAGPPSVVEHLENPPAVPAPDVDAPNNADAPDNPDAPGNAAAPNNVAALINAAVHNNAAAFRKATHSGTSLLNNSNAGGHEDKKNEPNPTATKHSKSIRPPQMDTSTLYKSLLSNCSDLKNLSTFSKEPIFSICSNWTTSDQNITLVPRTNATRALCTVYYNSLTTLCTKLKSFNKSLSQSGIELNLSPPAKMSLVDVAATCMRLSEQSKLFNSSMYCMESCYANETFLSQCYLADRYFNYKYTPPAPTQVDTISFSKGANAVESPAVQTHLVNAATTKSSNTKDESQEPIQANNPPPVNEAEENNPEKSIPKVQHKLPKTGHPNPEQQERNESDNAGVENVHKVNSGPEGKVKLPKKVTTPDQAQVVNNDELIPAVEQPKKPSPQPQEGEEEDNQDLAFEKDKDNMDPPEEDFAEEGAPKQTDGDNEEKSIAKPNQLEKDIPISEDDIDGESYFFSYFMVVCVLFVLGYVFYHNRTKVMALVIEGKRNKRQYRGRRPNSANYHKLDSNLEEAISSSCTKSKSNVIY